MGAFNNPGTVVIIGTTVTLVNEWLDLDDTPFGYTGEAGNIPVVNAAETGLTFTAFPGAGTTTFLDLFDTPFNYVGEANMFVVVNPAETGLTFSSVAASTVADFLGLLDTPFTYAGSSSFLVRVNLAGTGLEFASITSLISTATSYLDLIDSPFGYDGDAGSLVQINPTETGLTHTTYAFPSIVGTQGQILTVDVNGDLVFVTSSAGTTPSFLDLTDTPTTYTGASGFVPIVLPSESGLTFTDIASLVSTATSYLDLIDSPFGYSGDAGTLVQINPTETGLTHTDFAFPSVVGTQGQVLSVDVNGNLIFTTNIAGTPSFLDLTDTPFNYAGESGTFARVNDTESGLTFTNIFSLISTVSSFLDLVDTPTSYFGEGGRQVIVETGEAGLTFSDVVTGATTFLDLLDTFSSYAGQSGAFIVINENETGLTTSVGGGGGSTVSTFLDLTDTFGSYAGLSNAFLVVNASETGIVAATETFSLDDIVDTVIATTSFLKLLDTPSSYVGESGNIVVIDESETGLTFTSFNNGLWQESSVPTTGLTVTVAFPNPFPTVSFNLEKESSDDALYPLTSNLAVALTRSVATTQSEYSLFVETLKTGALSSSLGSACFTSDQKDGETDFQSSVINQSILSGGTVSSIVGDYAESLVVDGSFSHSIGQIGISRQEGGTAAASSQQVGVLGIATANNNISSIPVLGFGVSGVVEPSGAYLLAAGVIGAIKAGITVTSSGSGIFGLDSNEGANTWAGIFEGDVQILNRIERPFVDTFSIATTVSDFDLGDTSNIRITTGGGALTGILEDRNGAEFNLHNTSAATISILNQSTSSVAANRIITGTDGDVDLGPDCSFQFIYDSTSDRWRILNAPVRPDTASGLQDSFAFAYGGF